MSAEAKSAEDEYNELSSEFEKVAKRILIFKTDKKRTIPTDKAKVLKYKTDIVEAYNNFIQFIARVFESQTKGTQEALHRDFENVHKPKLRECLKLFNLTAQLPENFLPLDIDTVVDLDTSEAGGITQQPTDIQSTSSATQSNTDNISDSENDDDSLKLSDEQIDHNSKKTVDAKQLSPIQIIRNTDTPENNTMPQTRQEFLKMAASVLNYKYDADPLKLECFLADVEIVEAMAEDEHKEFCMKFVKAKLDQKALEHLPEANEIKSLKDITDALRKGIKVETSEVVEGKMLALRVNRGNYSEFTKKAEDLAEEYCRSLRAENISKAKAKEMAVKKTIELCRKLTPFETVKSVISIANQYSKPSEVLAAFVTQSEIAKKEKREADAKQNLNKNSNGYRGKNKFGNRGGQNRGQNGQNKDNRDQSNGRGRSNGGRGSGSYRGGRSGGNYRGSQPRNEQTIRLVAAQAQPAQANQQSAQGEALSEQFFRLST